MNVLNTFEEHNAILNDHLFFKISNSNFLEGRNKNFWAPGFFAVYSGKFHTVLSNTSTTKEAELTFLQDTVAVYVNTLKVTIMLTCITTMHLGISLEKQKFKAEISKSSAKYVGKTIHLLWNFVDCMVQLAHAISSSVHTLIRFVCTKQRLAQYLWKVHLYVFSFAMIKMSRLSVNFSCVYTVLGFENIICGGT